MVVGRACDPETHIETAAVSDALKAIADDAIARKVGARGLKIILEELMLDVMYRVPSEEEIEECVITKEVVQRRAAPILSLRKAG